MKKVAVVGGGFGGLASAALLARRGFQVELFEKNPTCGGRARYWKTDGFSFDMGPSWYLMPEVFERFFGSFGASAADFYALTRLPVSYRAFFGPSDYVDVESSPRALQELFDSFEPNGGRKLLAYLANAAEKYRIAMDGFLYRDYRHVGQFLSPRVLIQGARLGVLGGLDKLVARYFQSRKARQILEYAMVFLGTDPRRAPGMYSLMSHVDLEQGVYYPTGGMAGVAQAIEGLARSEGVQIHTGAEVDRIEVDGTTARALWVNGDRVAADAVLVNADYAWAETNLLPPKARSFNAAVWQKKTIAPGMFIIYLGTKAVGEKLSHHNLYFQEDWTNHFDTVFKQPGWPEDPCFYLSVISKTEANTAPAGQDNVFVLVPVAAGLDDADRAAYGGRILRHIERITGVDLQSGASVQRIFSQRDFEADYHAFQGTALGLSHTLGQSAAFRPPFRSRRVDGLYYCGQYTHPGIGVPMVLIAAELAVQAIQKDAA